MLSEERKTHNFIWKKLSPRSNGALRIWQFRLLTLMVLFTLSALILALAQNDEIVEKYHLLKTTLPLEKSDRVLIVLCMLCALPVLFATGFVTYKLGTRLGFLACAVLTCIAAISATCAATLQIDPLHETPLKDLQANQGLYVALLFLSIAVPLGSLMGWYVSAENRPS